MSIRYVGKIQASLKLHRESLGCGIWSEYSISENMIPKGDSATNVGKMMFDSDCLNLFIRKKIHKYKTISLNAVTCEAIEEVC